MVDGDIAARRDAALAFLLGRIDYERTPAASYSAREFRLARMRELLSSLGNAHKGLPVIHIAGTKGKGSTAAMVAAILSAAGYRTGLYSSPHLYRIEERMAVDGVPCSADELVELVAQVRPVVEAMDERTRRGRRGPTYFEITTAMALVHFVRRKVEAAVLEVGMGGRLDSTNVCEPLVSVITSISFDHTRQLGNTLAAIAREKAGIIKPGIPVVSGVVAAEPASVIRDVCRRQGSSLVELGKDFRFEYQPPSAIARLDETGRLDFEYHGAAERRRLDELRIGPLGRHQGANAAVALAALALLGRQGWRVSEQAIRRGLLEVRCPARVEVVALRPAVVIDAAHNVASVAALLEALSASFKPRRRVLVFATTLEKDHRGMLSLLLPWFDEVIFTRYQNNPRGVPPEELVLLAGAIREIRAQVCAEPATAWQAVRQLAAFDDLVCVTGSFFIAAEMRPQIERYPFPKAEPVPAETV